MTEDKSKYRVDRKQIDEYLKRRFTSVSITASIIAVVVFSDLAYILYKQGATDALWIFFICIPVCAAAYFYGVKRWNDKLRTLADTEFELTSDSIVQSSETQVRKSFKFSEIAVVHKKKFGTLVVKGGWLTKIDYYRPKNTPYQLGEPGTIFIPTITTNYDHLIDAIKKARKLSRKDNFS